MATLQPPSFFQTTLPQGGEARDKEAPQTISSPKSLQDELIKLRQENKSLRERVATTKPPPAVPKLQHQPLLQSPPHIPTLTSNLLHIEECLQSKVRLYECEREEASMRVTELERALAHQKVEFREKIEKLNAEHEERVATVQSEKRRLSVEYQAHKEDKEANIKHLEAELIIIRDQNCTQVKQLLANITELENTCTVLESNKQKVTQNLEDNLALVTEQLATSKKENENQWTESQEKLNALTSQLTTHCQRIKELEAYLGGEIPKVEGEREGHTWREEREILYGDVQKYEHEIQRLQSENKLLNIRLVSLTEILTLQESDISKKCGEGVGGNVRSLLTRWREKVFMLLVQKKLQEIEDCKKWEDLKKKEISLSVRVEETEREWQLLSHALADRTAQLQLQETKTKEVDLELEKGKAMLGVMEDKLCSEHNACVNMRNSIMSMDEVFSGFKFSFNQALTRLANYEQRIAFAVKRIQSIKASLNCQYALLSCQIVGKADAECQVCEVNEENKQPGVSSLTRGQLEQEMYVLSQERDTLITHLEDSAGAFQRQLKSMKDEYLSERRRLEDHLKETETGHAALKEDLAEIQCKLDLSDRERGNLIERSQELKGKLKALEATMESRIESELTKEKQKSREELSDMEKLLNVAKREHAKAIVQLQQLTRQLTRDKEIAAEAAEVGRTRLERELTASRKKLQSVQVERNLLLTTVRQEGLVSPLKSKHLVRSQQRRRQDLDCAAGSSELPPGGASISHPRTSKDEEELEDDQKVCRKSDSILTDGAGQNGKEQEDIRDVLKDLQMLSASALLSMEPPPIQ